MSDPALPTIKSHWLTNTALWYFSIINSFPDTPKDSRRFHTSRQHITYKVLIYILPMLYNHIFHRKEGDTHNHHTVLSLPAANSSSLIPGFKKTERKKHKHVN